MPGPSSGASSTRTRLYLGAAALNVMLDFDAKITLPCPQKASGLASAVLLVGEKIGHPRTMEQLEVMQDELERFCAAWWWGYATTPSPATP
jgi:hypothetical protein